MPKSAARVLDLLPYRLKVVRSGARPSGPSGPKERSGQTDGARATRQRSRAPDGNPTSAKDLPPRDRDRGALNRSAANQSAAEDNHPSNITKTRLGARGRLGRVGATRIQNNETYRVG